MDLSFVDQQRMMGRARSAALVGVDSVPIDIEAQIFGALRRLAIVGLPDGVLREAKDRVRCAIENSGFAFPEHEVVISLVPAGLPKSGSGFDLGIALSVLAAAGIIPQELLQNVILLGELALDGTLRPVRGVLAASSLTRSLDGMELLVPHENAAEAMLVNGARVRSARSLCEVVSYLLGYKELPLHEPEEESPPSIFGPGFGDVIGQTEAKRAMEVAAAGGHNLLMVGPPGAGKSMLAERLPSILPLLTPEEQIEVSKIHSVCLTAGDPGNVVCRPSLIRRRPYRAPHHNTSCAGLIGGGPLPVPGEISLAHRGVLFLDEVTELRRDVLEALRQPLENKRITISRAKIRLSFPADFMLVAAMNPCPCGKRGVKEAGCCCPQNVVARYLSRVSGPILDRMDLQLWIPPVPPDQLRSGPTSDPTVAMRERVRRARIIQAERLHREGGLNSQLRPDEMTVYCKLDTATELQMEKAIAHYRLSARGYNRVLKVARTIADMEESVRIELPHLVDAIAFRMSLTLKPDVLPAKPREERKAVIREASQAPNSAEEAGGETM